MSTINIWNFFKAILDINALILHIHSHRSFVFFLEPSEVFQNAREKVKILVNWDFNELTLWFLNLTLTCYWCQLLRKYILYYRVIIWIFECLACFNHPDNNICMYFPFCRSLIITSVFNIRRWKEYPDFQVLLFTKSLCWSQK